MYKGADAVLCMRVPPVVNRAFRQLVDEEGAGYILGTFEDLVRPLLEAMPVGSMQACRHFQRLGFGDCPQRLKEELWRWREGLVPLVIRIPLELHELVRMQARNLNMSLGNLGTALLTLALLRTAQSRSCPSSPGPAGATFRRTRRRR